MPLANRALLRELFPHTTWASQDRSDAHHGRVLDKRMARIQARQRLEYMSFTSEQASCVLHRVQDELMQLVGGDAVVSPDGCVSLWRFGQLYHVRQMSASCHHEQDDDDGRLCFDALWSPFNKPCSATATAITTAASSSSEYMAVAGFKIARTHVSHTRQHVALLLDAIDTHACRR
jgi:hypothetical protein